MSWDWLRNGKLMIIQLKSEGARSRVVRGWAAGKHWASGKELEREKRGAKRANSDCKKRKVLGFKRTSCVILEGPASFG